MRRFYVTEREPGRPTLWRDRYSFRAHSITAACLLAARPYLDDTPTITWRPAPLPHRYGPVLEAAMGGKVWRVSGRGAPVRHEDIKPGDRLYWHDLTTYEPTRVPVVVCRPTEKRVTVRADWPHGRYPDRARSVGVDRLTRRWARAWIDTDDTTEPGEP